MLKNGSKSSEINVKVSRCLKHIPGQHKDWRKRGNKGHKVMSGNNGTNKKLTLKQQSFVDQYLIYDGNGVKAEEYIRDFSGYSMKLLD